MILIFFTGLQPQYDSIWRGSQVDTVIDPGQNLPAIEIKVGDHVRGNFRKAHKNVSKPGFSR